jgi:hypothetical protein
MSIAMTNCPYCDRRVLVNNGRCPACDRDLDSGAAQRHLFKQKASSIAKAARAKGASFGEIETELIKGGISEELIREIMMEVEGKTPQAMAEKNDLDMRQGVRWLLGGTLVTAVTYMIARSSENGGLYIIAWGPVVTGGIQFMRAFLKAK